MRYALRLVDRFWFSEAPAARLALLRIIVGGYALYSLSDRFNSFLRNAGTSPALFEPVGPVSILAAPLAIAAFQALLTATLILNVIFLLGWGHRLTGPLFGLLLLWVLSYRNSWGMIFHTDNLLALQVIVLGFTHSADALSLDALERSSAARGPLGLLRGWRLRERRPGWQYGYAIRLLCLVTALTYFLSGVAKLAGPLGASWAVGESLRTQIAFDVWRKELLVADPPRLIFSLYDQLWLFTAFGVGTLILELGAPLALLSGWIAAVWVPSILLMHWGISLIMGIEFPYQLSGVAFAPFIPLDRVLGWFRPARASALAASVRLPRPASLLRSSPRRAGPLIGLVLMLSAGVGRGSADSPADFATRQRPESGQPYQIVWVGDVLLADAAEPLFEAQGYGWPFEYLRDALAGDFAIGNAEGPITTRRARYFEDQRWSYNAQPEAADALAQVGFGALSLANNHAFDRGPDGLADTVEHFRRVGIQAFGAGQDIDEAATPLLIRSPYGSVAVLAFSEGGAARPPAGPGEFGILQIDPTAMASYRARALEAGARWVVAYVHWGANYAPIRASQRRFASAFAEAGYDLVIGHHPHVPQPVEVVQGMPVLYSLGNFTFGARGRFSRDFPGYGLVAKTILDASGLRTIELTCIVTHNAVVAFQPRPCSEQEAQDVIGGLGPSVTWRDGKGFVEL